MNYSYESSPERVRNNFGTPQLGRGGSSQGSCETDTQRQNESRAVGHLDLDALDRLIEEHTDQYGRITSADIFIETGKTIPLSEIEERLDYLGYSKLWHGGWRTAKNDDESKVKGANENTLASESGINSFPSERLDELKEPKKQQEQEPKAYLETLTPDQVEILIKVARRLAQEHKSITGFTLAFEARSQGLEITPSLCQQWMESLPVNPSAPMHEIDIEWLQDPMRYEYLRESIQVMTRNASGKFQPSLPRGSILVGYGINQAQWQHGKLYTRRFWWVAAYDRDLEPKGVYRKFSPSEAVIPSSIKAGHSSLNYSIIEERTPGRKMNSSRNEMVAA
jgi:hypothetical protein